MAAPEPDQHRDCCQQALNVLEFRPIARSSCNSMLRAAEQKPDSGVVPCRSIRVMAPSARSVGVDYHPTGIWTNSIADEIGGPNNTLVLAVIERHRYCANSPSAARNCSFKESQLKPSASTASPHRLTPQPSTAAAQPLLSQWRVSGSIPPDSDQSQRATPLAAAECRPHESVD